MNSKLISVCTYCLSEKNIKGNWIKHPIVPSELNALLFKQNIVDFKQLHKEINFALSKIRKPANLSHGICPSCFNILKEKNHENNNSRYV